MGIDAFAMGFAAYFVIAYVVGFIWTLLDARIRNGYVRESDFTEALVFSLPAFIWVPIRIVVEALRLFRWAVLALFNIGTK